MDISFLDLRRNPGRLLKAIERNEPITLSRRGKIVARIEREPSKAPCNVAEHEAFGIWADRDDLTDPVESVRKMRRGRLNAI